MSNNNIGQNLFSSLLYAKAEKNSKGNVNVKGENIDEELKRLDTNKDGVVSKKEAQANFYDVTGDKKISSEDLGIYTAFISFAKNYSDFGNHSVGMQDFDIDKDGQLDDEEKILQSLIDSNNDGEFDEDIFDLLFENQELDDKLFESLEKEIATLNGKINPSDTRYNRVLDAKTGNLLSQTYVETKDGVETTYNISYTYYEGTKTVKRKNILNENTGVNTIRKYNEKGKLTEKVVNEDNPQKRSVYSDYVNGHATKLTTTTTVDGKKTTTNYSISHTYYNDGDTVKTKTITNENTGTVTLQKYDKNGEITEKETTTKSGKKTTYTYNDNGQVSKKVTVAKNGDKTTYLYDENGEVTQKSTYNKSLNTTKKYSDYVNGHATKMTTTETINGKKVTTEYDISYTYYDNTNTPKTKTVTNKTTNVETLSKYDVDGNVVEKIATDKDTGEVKKYTDYVNGRATKMSATKTEYGKEVTTNYSISYTYHKGTDTPKTKTIVNENTGTVTLYKYDKNSEVTEKRTTSQNPKKVNVYSDYKNGYPTKLTSTKTSNGKETTTTCSISYSYHAGTNLVKSKKYTNLNTGTTTVRKYNTDGELTKKEITKKNSDKTTYVYDENGKVIQKEVTGKNASNTTIAYDENGSRTEKVVTKKNSKTTYLYDEKGNVNKKIVETKNKTLTYNADEELIQKEETTKDSKGNTIKTTYLYDEKGKVSKKTIEKKDATIVYNYLKYGKKNYVKEYEVEYIYANGIHTKSKITQEKLEKSDNDYIVSSENYQFINGEALLVSELHTISKENNKGIETEGTERIFYFYDENNNLIKKEETFSFNNEEVAGKPLSTNSQYQINDKVITTYIPGTNTIASTITYDKKTETITTTTYENGVPSEIKQEKFDNNSYENHNIKNVSREDFLKEALKYKGFNRLDGSYSIFGTNGSACATFATYVMYQMGFDLTSVTTRTTHGLREQAINEGRYTSINNVFNRLKNESIEEIIKPGDLLTKMNGDGSSSHTAIVQSAKYNKKTGEIELKILGYESNTSSTGVKENTYTIKKNSDGTITFNGVKRSSDYILGFADFLS